MKNKYACPKCNARFSDRDLMTMMIVSGQCPFDGTELEDANATK